MVRACGAESYDVIIADIRLPDMSGYEFLMRLREFRDAVPLVLMTGFGYDPGHSIVKAREMGMRTLREDGTRKVLAGVTTVDEVVRATVTDH